MRTTRRSAVLLLAVCLVPSARGDGPVRPFGEERVLDVGEARPIPSLGFTPDGRTLLTAHSDETLARWDVATGRRVGVVPLRLPPEDTVSSQAFGSAFSADGTRFLAVVRSAGFAVFDADTGAVVAHGGPAGRTGSIDPSANGTMVLTAGTPRKDNRTVLVATVTTPGSDGPPVERVFAGVGQLTSSRARAALSPDVAVTVGRVGRVYVRELVSFRTADGETVAREETPFASAAVTLAIAPDNRSVVVTGSNRDLVLWDAATGRRRHLLDAAPCTGTSPRCSPPTGGRSLYSLSRR
jgi:WD40 repeat protein